MCRMLFWLCVGCALMAQVQADIYMRQAADGSLILTNIPPQDGGHVRVYPESQPPRASSLGHVRPVSARPYAQLIDSVAATHALPPALLHAVIEAESGYNAQAHSPKGAAGLMQLMPDTARELGVADVWDPAQNIDGGARYLKRMLQLFDDDLSLALAAYNAGPGAVRSSGRAVPPYAETRRYVPSVLERYEQLAKQPRFVF